MTRKEDRLFLLWEAIHYGSQMEQPKRYPVRLWPLCVETTNIQTPYGHLNVIVGQRIMQGGQRAGDRQDGDLRRAVHRGNMDQDAAELGDWIRE